MSLGIGIIGCGVISRKYFDTFDRLDAAHVARVADRDEARARSIAEQRGYRASSVEDLLGADDVDAVVNLTTPNAHAAIAHAAINAGKAVFNEKPLAATTSEGRDLVAAASSAGVRLGCAPDTVLGTGTQTARKAVDDGLIGIPVAATATMAGPGPDRWHPNPDFYFVPGGGPLFDMGPYYIAALVHMLGPVAEVFGTGARPRQHRTINSGDRAGEPFPVQVDTHVTGGLVHASGAVSTIVMSFDTAASHAVPIEVHGLDGSLTLGPPNKVAEPVQARMLGEKEWSALPESAGFRDCARGYGVVDMMATPAGEEPRAGGALGLHVLDVMETLLRAGEEKRTLPVGSTCERPALVPFTEDLAVIASA